MSHRLAAAAVLAVLFSVFSLVPAHAKPLAPNSVTLKVGGYFPQHSDLDSFDSGFNGEISLGHLVAPGFAIEGGIGYFETKGPVATPLGTADEKIKVMPLTFSLKGQTFFQQFEPYIEAGIGVYFIKDELVVPGVASESENDTPVGFHLGLGGNFNVTRQLFVGLEGKYLWLKMDTFGADVRLDGITLTGNVGFRF